MADKPRIYIESCPLIDMAKHKAGIVMNDDPSIQSDREKNVWFCARILEAGRKGDLEVYGSMASIGECTHVGDGADISQDTKDFFNMLLCSGRSGMTLVAPMQSIWVQSRNLKWTEEVNLKPMDSLHVATAIHMGCTEFVTTDGRIYKARDKFAHKGIRIIRASETALLPSKYREQDLPDVNASFPF